MAKVCQTLAIKLFHKNGKRKGLGALTTAPYA
jgi:hypothetical protein